MTIDQLTAAAGARTAAKTGDESTGATANPLGQDAFMQLLLTQLQNQDPTSPQADGEFLAQLAQFSQLEQLQKMNEKLDQIAAVFSAITPTTTGNARVSTSTTESSASTSATGNASTSSSTTNAGAASVAGSN